MGPLLLIPVAVGVVGYLRYRKTHPRVSAAHKAAYDKASTSNNAAGVKAVSDAMMNAGQIAQAQALATRALGLAFLGSGHPAVQPGAPPVTTATIKALAAQASAQPGGPSFLGTVFQQAAAGGVGGAPAPSGASALVTASGALNIGEDKAGDSDVGCVKA